MFAKIISFEDEYFLEIGTINDLVFSFIGSRTKSNQKIRYDGEVFVTKIQGRYVADEIISVQNFKLGITTVVVDGRSYLLTKKGAKWIGSGLEGIQEESVCEEVE